MRVSLKLLVAVLLLIGLAFAAGAAEAPVPPVPARWATDTAGFLSPEALAMADRLLQSFEQASGHQVLLYIAPTTGDTPTEDWAVKAFAAWKVGSKRLDDGLVLFIFAQDRKVRIEVGYGLEDKVPDAIASRIIAETIVPRIQAGDNDGAVIQGLAAILRAIEPSMVKEGEGDGDGDGSARRLDESTKHLSEVASDLSLGQKIIVGLLILGFIVLLITNPGMALWLLFSLLSGGRGGGGGGGGFSGGGGSSGGGGATGSW